MTQSLANRHLARLKAAMTKTDGNVAIIFALCLTMFMSLLALSVDVSNTIALKRRLSEAADATALAATSAAGSGQSVAQATSEAMAVWSKNVTGADGTVAAPSISVVSNGGLATTTVNYSGSYPTSFASVFGMTSIAVAGTSKAQVAQTVQGSYAGSGSVWGDPHVDGADGSVNNFNCPNNLWYNLLSDSGIEINVQCYKISNGTYGIGTFEVMLGTHTISITQNMGPTPWNAVNNPASNFWWGKITIDGQVYDPGIGTTSYLNGAVVETIVQNTNGNNQAVNSVLITTPQYSIKLFYGGWGLGYADITGTAAGQCSKPGGFWGQTMAGIHDFNPADFVMASATATGFEFNNAACPLAGKVVRLIQ